MKLRRTASVKAAFVVTALALTLTGCTLDSAGAGPDASSARNASGLNLTGNLVGAGASSQGKAMEGWIAGFADAHPDVLPSYDPSGSGAGREQFLVGAVQFAGSDAALKPEEAATAAQTCKGGDVVELPLYISPIAIIYNLPSIKSDTEHLQLSAETIARIFNGDIITWNDPEIAAQNDGVALPDLDIIPVSRSDESGTTENLAEYLSAAGNGAWPHETSGAWPISGGQSGQGTSGVVDIVGAADGAIGYADASRAEDLGTVALQVGSEYVPFSPQAAATVVDSSPRAATATDTRLVVDLDRTTTAAGAYPLVLISYSIACTVYEDAEAAANVQAFLTYVASPEGQARASAPTVAGAAPISPQLHDEVMTIIDSISTH